MRPLIAGPEGVTVLALERTRLLAHCEDDAVLGTHLLWNIAAAVAQRTRFVFWLLDRAMLRAAKKPADESAGIQALLQCGVTLVSESAGPRRENQRGR